MCMCVLQYVKLYICMCFSICVLVLKIADSELMLDCLFFLYIFSHLAVRYIYFCNGHIFLTWPFYYEITPFLVSSLGSILPGITLTTPPMVTIAWFVFFYPSTFNLFRSFNLKYVSYRELTVDSS